MIAEMLAAHIAANVDTLKAVRPMAAARHDAFPHVIYETTSMRNLRNLNCPSRQWEGSVRFYICGLEYADVSTITETLKDLLIGYSETGAVYRIRLCDLDDEGDVGQEESEEGQAFYAKSIDIRVKALKLTA